jgi:hypothetical protein
MSDLGVENLGDPAELAHSPLSFDGDRLIQVWHPSSDEFLNAPRPASKTTLLTAK